MLRLALLYMMGGEEKLFYYVAIKKHYCALCKKIFQKNKNFYLYISYRANFCSFLLLNVLLIAIILILPNCFHLAAKVSAQQI